MATDETRELLINRYGRVFCPRDKKWRRKRGDCEDPFAKNAKNCPHFRGLSGAFGEGVEVSCGFEEKTVIQMERALVGKLKEVIGDAKKR